VHLCGIDAAVMEQRCAVDRLHGVGIEPQSLSALPGHESDPFSMLHLVYANEIESIGKGVNHLSGVDLKGHNG
jgi:hypothetical protein